MVLVLIVGVVFVFVIICLSGFVLGGVVVNVIEENVILLW